MEREATYHDGIGGNSERFKLLGANDQHKNPPG